MNKFSEVNVTHKKVLLRTDFDVATNETKITEPFRIEKQKPAIEMLVNSGAQVLMVAHIAAADSFEPFVGELGELLGKEIVFIKSLNDITSFLQSEHKLGLLENIRMWPGEETNDLDFAKQLTQGFDLYINNAFAVAHREHASVVGVTKYLAAQAGPLIEEEVEQLQAAINAPAEGKVIIMGGAKASTKVPVIKSLLPNTEAVLVGGVIANDILKARGVDVKRSVVDENAVELLQGLDVHDEKIVVPTDFEINEEKYLDIGIDSITSFVEKIKSAKTIIWNGPVGMFEDKRFMAGTEAVALAVSESSALSILGGGDTIAAVHQLGLLEKFTFVSTGGGALLVFLAGGELPGLKALGYHG
jgi:3-phosphoglycerate kinase